MGAKGKTAQETIEKTTAFEVWYSNGRIFEKTRAVLSEADPPVEVSAKTLYRWAVTYKWTERAVERDREIGRKLREKSIKERSDFLERQIASGRLLQSKGLKYLRDDVPQLLDPNDPAKGYKPDTGKGGIKSDYAAIQALKTGLELERFGMELPDQTVGNTVKAEVVFRVIREKKEKKKRESNGEDEE